MQDVQVVQQARGKIMRLQEEMLALPESERVECSVTHHFAPGMYAREMLIPEGTLIIGKVHRHAHLNTISAGLCRVYTESGIKEIQGPYTFTSQVGTKRVVYAVTDVIWTTYHANPDNTEDLDVLESQIISETFLALPEE